MRVLNKTVSCITGALLPIVAVSDTGFISKIEGYYSVLARNCTESDGEKQVQCDPPAADCMMIKRIDEKHAKIYVYSLQWNGSQCGIDGVAELHGNTLQYRERKDSMSLGQQVNIQFTEGKVTFRYVGPSDLPVAPFCGVRARLDAVEFNLKDKEPLSYGTCPDAERF